MIVALLILIVLILLFGAAAIKSAIVRIVLVGGALILGAVALSTLLEAFGQEALNYGILGLVGFTVLVCVVVVHLENRKLTRQTGEMERARERERIRRLPKIERLWFHYSKDIERFDPGAKHMARRYYDAKNVHGLREFCRDQINRLR